MHLHIYGYINIFCFNTTSKNYKESDQERRNLLKLLIGTAITRLSAIIDSQTRCPLQAIIRRHLWLLCFNRSFMEFRWTEIMKRWSVRIIFDYWTFEVKLNDRIFHTQIHKTLWSFWKWTIIDNFSDGKIHLLASNFY